MPDAFTLEANAKVFESFYSTKKILITGGRGYLGSCVSSALSNTGALIYLLDHSPSTWLPSNANNVRLVNANVAHAESFEEILGEVDFVFHLAALEYRRDSYDLLEDYLNNAKSVADIMETCVKHSARPTIIFSSSANIFGIQQSLPVSERSSNNPPSLWSAHKLLAENYISYYSMKYNFKSTILRLPNVFGPTARQETFVRSSINKMILAALASGVIDLYSNSHCLRDQIFSTDAVHAFLLAGMYAREAFEDNTFVLGCGIPCTYLSLAETISKQVTNSTRRHIDIRYRNDKFREPLDQRSFLADFRAFSSLTGWVPEKSLEERIGETIYFAIQEVIR